MATAGVEVLAEDLLVMDGANALAGPRCIDLRQLVGVEAARGMDVRRVRGGTRWRLALPEVAQAVPLLGWVFLTWGTGRAALEPVPIATRLAWLAKIRRWAIVESDPRGFLELASLPGWQLTRGKGAALIGETIERLLEAARGG
jgi:hypothetical protein